MIIAINYADGNFRKAQKYNTKTAYSKGKIDKVIEYSPENIDTVFKNDNKKIFNYKRGAGLWLWKPYIILKTLENIKYGDYLFYCDSGAYYINKIQYLIDSMELQSAEMMVYELPLISKQWTKAETFKNMGCDEEKYKESNQVLATYILLKKTKKTVAFFEEFLEWCCDEKTISYIVFDDSIKEDEAFIAHREDQSIFSILCTKHNIIKFKEPSQFGNRPWEYLQKDFLYNPKKHSNSQYPQVIASYRRENIFKFKIKENIKNILSGFNLYNEAFYMNKRGISKI